MVEQIKSVKNMKYRKFHRPYLIYSLLIHIVLLLGVWWFASEDESPLPFIDEIIGDFVLMPRSAVLKPLEPIEPPPVKTDTPIEEVKKSPAPPKPTVDLNAEWLTTNSDQESIPTAGIRRQENLKGQRKSNDTFTAGTHNVRNTNIGQKIDIQTTNVKINRDLFALSITSADPQAETNPIQLDTSATLNGVSPTVGAPKIHYGSQRGDALRATGISNAWGGGGYSGGGKAGGNYIEMMKDIAQELTAATTSEKVDIVFIIDETASMVDNIRGIRAYFEYFYEVFQREGLNANYGLVTFTDKTKMHGQTDDLGKFRNWLFKIDVDHGGDISESGLDALMTAVKKIKFRRNAQRFFILASDAAFHDADYDGRSVHSLDEVIATLQKEQIRVEVIGIDYLPIKQIAMATGGTWRAIPGKGYLEYVPPITLTAKMLSKLGTLSIDGGTVGDKITVYVNNPPRPKQLTLTWKVLNPLGERCYGPFKEKIEIPDDTSTKIELTPALDSTAFQTIPGIYTVIYRLENDQGHKSILRRTLTY